MLQSVVLCLHIPASDESTTIYVEISYSFENHFYRVSDPLTWLVIFLEYVITNESQGTNGLIHTLLRIFKTIMKSGDIISPLTMSSAPRCHFSYPLSASNQTCNFPIHLSQHSRKGHNIRLNSCYEMMPSLP